MITLIGVGHVFAISDDVKRLILERRPDIVCLELDVARFNALMQKRAGASDRRAVPLQYRLLAYFQKRMAEQYGTEVGDEMLAGADAAQEIGSKLALIDMDAAKVFANLWRSMSFRERLTLFTGAFAGLFVSKKRVEQEIQKFESQEDQYIEVLSQGFPTLKHVLIDDRNTYMAEKLVALRSEFSTVVAVVGDGHVPGLTRLLGSSDLEIIRLKDIRNHNVPKDGSAEFKTSYWYHSQ
jgi:pheromone shutdown protein TraB